MNHTLATRDLRCSPAAISLTFLAVAGGIALVLPLSISGSLRLIGFVLGAIGAIGAACLSCNFRLCCPWGLMFTVPFDVSKSFGPIVQKMGAKVRSGSS